MPLRSLCCWLLLLIAAPIVAAPRDEALDAALKTALRSAEETGDLKPVIRLVKQGANPDVRNMLGRTALQRLAGHSNLECLQLLIDHGAKVNRSDNFGFTALILAARESNR